MKGSNGGIRTGKAHATSVLNIRQLQRREEV
jgi:hypothetical protein